jgi:dTDP-4-dehydrorhamnose 3,5-epimerase
MIEALALSGAFLIRPKRYSDDRGWFVETYNKEAFREAVGDVEFVQDNQSLSVHPFTLRGMHYQIPPKAQGKLVRVQRGSVFDVIIDIRRGSPTYGRHVSVTLTAEGGEQLYAPPGMAHGFLTLEPQVEVAYKVTSLYNKASERGVLWRDPALGIDWPRRERIRVADRDDQFPAFADLEPHFQVSAPRAVRP